jgi:hypothetical protein
VDVLVRHQIFWNSFSRREVSTDKVVTLFPMTVQSRLRRSPDAGKTTAALASVA